MFIGFPGLSLLTLLLGGLSTLPWLWRELKHSPINKTRRAHANKRATPSARLNSKPATAHVDTAVLLDLTGAACRAGVSIPEAISAVGTAIDCAELRQVGAKLLLGAPWAEAWATVPARYAPLTRALQPAWEFGAAPGALLERTAASIRHTRLRRAREAAELLGVRLMLPLGLCMLPAFVLLGIVPVLLTVSADFLLGS